MGAGVSDLGTYYELSLSNRLLLAFSYYFSLDVSEMARAELLHFFHSLSPLSFRLPSWNGIPDLGGGANGNERRALREVI